MTSPGCLFRHKNITSTLPNVGSSYPYIDHNHHDVNFYAQATNPARPQHGPKPLQGRHRARGPQHPIPCQSVGVRRCGQRRQGAGVLEDKSQWVSLLHPYSVLTFHLHGIFASSPLRSPPPTLTTPLHTTAASPPSRTQTHPSQRGSPAPSYPTSCANTTSPTASPPPLAGRRNKASISTPGLRSCCPRWDP
jgi:hypothetical protein